MKTATSALLALVACGVTTVAHAADGTLKCQATDKAEKKQIGTLIVNFDDLTVKASKRTQNMAGETMTIEKASAKKGVEVYRGTNDAGDMLTFYIPLDLRGDEVLMDWQSGVDAKGRAVNNRYSLTCKESK